MKQKKLGEFELTVMSAILELGEEAYGVRIHNILIEKAGKTVAIGAIYTTLSRLEKKGYVSSHKGEPTAERGGRAKRYYSITPLGREALEATRSALQNALFGLGAL